VIDTAVLEKAAAFLFYPEDKGSGFLRHTGIHLSNFMAFTSQNSVFLIFTAMRTSNLSNVLPDTAFRKPMAQMERY
jgi:hypothetical protein